MKEDSKKRASWKRQKQRTKGEALIDFLQGREYFMGLITNTFTITQSNTRLSLLVDVCKVNVCHVAPAGAAGTSSGRHFFLRWLRIYFYL